MSNHRPETPIERRHRLQSGWTEEDHAREEDHAHRRSVGILRQQEEIRALRSGRTEKATATVRAQGDAHRARAAELKAQGLSAPQIGVRMAQDEPHRSEPYSERVVRRWLAARKG